MRMLRRLLPVLLLLALLPATVGAQERRVALVIGNGAYERGGTLPNAVTDAEDMATTLRGLGFTVTLERNQGIAAMRQALRRFGEAAQGADIALLFYSGHGVQMGQRDRAENFLVPVDARLADARDAGAETIALSGVLDWMEGARARVVILDACRDNPLVARMANASGTRSVGRGLAPLDAAGAQGTLVAFSTAPGAVALDGDGRNSPFTAALVRHLPTRGIEIRGALTRVRADVARVTGNAQVPWSNDGLLSELFLAGVSPPVAPPPAPAVSPEALDLALWQSVQGSRSVVDFEEYLRRFPDGVFAGVARNRMAELRSAAVQTQATAAPEPEPDRQQVAVVVPALPGATATRTVPSGYPVAVGQRFRDCADCPEMMVIPAGSFVMGSPEDEPGRMSSEGPQRTVQLSSPLAVGQFEVTFAEWDACVAARGCRRRPSDHGWGRGTRPVINVSWEDAQQYVRWLSGRTGLRYRLLTEAAWEYAARAGTSTAYSFGSTISPRQANYGDSDGARTQPVGSYAANAFGLHDMAGNVWEWVEDCYRDSYAGAPLDAAVAVVSARCPARVLRGGSWLFTAPSHRAANRFDLPGSFQSEDIGFRVARTPGR